MPSHSKRPSSGPSRPSDQPKAEAERVCSACGVKLSTYNPNPTCWQHTIGYPWRGPTAKPKFD